MRERFATIFLIASPFVVLPVAAAYVQWGAVGLPELSPGPALTPETTAGPDGVPAWLRITHHVNFRFQGAHLRRVESTGRHRFQGLPVAGVRPDGEPCRAFTRPAPEPAGVRDELRAAVRTARGRPCACGSRTSSDSRWSNRSGRSSSSRAWNQSARRKAVTTRTITSPTVADLPAAASYCIMRS